MPLKKKDIKDLHDKLLAERTRILRHLNDLKGSVIHDSDALVGDHADIASIELTQAAVAQRGEQEKKVLKLINHALAKIEADDETYGVCEYSGEDIPIERLKISPWAKYTVEAKEEIERQERSFAKGGSVDNEDDGSYNEDGEEED